jgi:hypothetical protein
MESSNHIIIKVYNRSTITVLIVGAGIRKEGAKKDIYTDIYTIVGKNAIAINQLTTTLVAWTLPTLLSWCNFTKIGNYCFSPVTAATPIFWIS